MPSNVIDITGGTFVFTNNTKWKVVRARIAKRQHREPATASGDGKVAYHVLGVYKVFISGYAVLEPGDLRLEEESDTATLTLASGHTLAGTFSLDWDMEAMFNPGRLPFGFSGEGNGVDLSSAYTPPA